MEDGSVNGNFVRHYHRMAGESLAQFTGACHLMDGTFPTIGKTTQ
jgi:hypothetical protein